MGCVGGRSQPNSFRAFRACQVVGSQQTPAARRIRVPWPVRGERQVKLRIETGIESALEVSSAWMDSGVLRLDSIVSWGALPRSGLSVRSRGPYRLSRSCA